MPLITYHHRDLPVRVAGHLRLETCGAVTILSGGRVATFDGEMRLDRNLTYELLEPIPYLILNSTEMIEARQGGKLYIAGSGRTLLLRRGEANVALIYAAPENLVIDDGCPLWRIYSRAPVANALKVLLEV